MQLTPVMERYVLHWGEMGTRWGVNRTVAQIHALLYLSSKPLPADEIAETLSVARSNVSTSIKELQSWGLVTMTHVLGDRRDHFDAKSDLWELLTTIVEERKKREIDPTLSMLRQCMLDAEFDQATDPAVLRRIEEMHTFMQELTDWYEDVQRLPKSTLSTLLRMGSKVARIAGGKKKKKKRDTPPD